MIRTAESLKQMAMRTGARVLMDGQIVNAARVIAPLAPPVPPAPPPEPVAPPPPAPIVTPAELQALQDKVRASAVRIAGLEEQLGDLQEQETAQPDLEITRDKKGLIKFITSTSGRKWEAIRDESTDQLLRLVAVGGGS